MIKLIEKILNFLSNCNCKSKCGSNAEIEFGSNNLISATSNSIKKNKELLKKSVSSPSIF